MNNTPPCQPFLSAAALEIITSLGYNSDALSSAAAALLTMAQHINHDWTAFNCIDALCEVAAELNPNQSLAESALEIMANAETVEHPKLLTLLTTAEHNAVCQALRRLNALERSSAGSALLSSGKEA